MGTRTSYPPAWQPSARAARMPILPPLPPEEPRNITRDVDDVLAELLDGGDQGVPWLVDLTPGERAIGTAARRAVHARPVAVASRDLDRAELEALRAADVEETLAASQPTTSAGRARPRNLTSRLVELGQVRPVVRIPARTQRQVAARGTAGARHTVKLPPIWLLANLLVLLFVGIAVVPRVVSVDAASACNWYTVVPGDTLGNLGVTYHSNALALANANHIQNPDLIYVGQRLCIPMTEWAQANSAPAVPQVSHPPTYGTASNVQDFVSLALPYARRAHDATGWPVSMILAQWGLEHGWTIPGFTGYNWGNSGGVPGFPTVNGTNVPGSPSSFAYGTTPDQGLAIYLHCAQLSYYKHVAPAASDGADAAAHALGRSPWDAGHYTDRGDPGSSLINIMRVYNLYWYDTH